MDAEKDASRERRLVWLEQGKLYPDPFRAVPGNCYEKVAFTYCVIEDPVSEEAAQHLVRLGLGGGWSVFGASTASGRGYDAVTGEPYYRTPGRVVSELRPAHLQRGCLRYEAETGRITLFQFGTDNHKGYAQQWSWPVEEAKDILIRME